MNALLNDAPFIIEMMGSVVGQFLAYALIVTIAAYTAAKRRKVRDIKSTMISMIGLSVTIPLIVVMLRPDMRQFYTQIGDSFIGSLYMLLVMVPCLVMTVFLVQLFVKNMNNTRTSATPLEPIDR